MSVLRTLARLAARDLRRRLAETALLFVALAVAGTTLTIGLILHGQTAAPYAQTRRETSGPDVVAALFPRPGSAIGPAARRALRQVARSPEVAARSGILPTTWSSIAAQGVTGVAQVQGRDHAGSVVDRPLVVDGHWVTRDGIVVERAFAQALHLRVGAVVSLGGTRVPVVGIAVSAALPPYPQLCTVGCILDGPEWYDAQPGLVWTTRARVAALATAREPIVLFQFLRLADPRAAGAFVVQHHGTGFSPKRPQLTTWQQVAGRQAEQLAHERSVVVLGSTLLVILALASLVVLVGGRLSDEMPRVGTLKAAGATPGFVTALILTANLAIGVVAALVGIAAGRLVAPSLITQSAGLLGHPGGTTVTLDDAVLVLSSLLVMVGLATTLPAWRAARMSTVRALASTRHRPRRGRLALRVSRVLPVPALIGLRVMSRRPRRALLAGLATAVAVCGTVVVLYAQAGIHSERQVQGGPSDPTVAQLHTVMFAVTVLLGIMAAVNLVFVARAAAIDSRAMLAVTRALGATPGESAAALAVAQLLPALVGLAIGDASGVVLFHALSSSHVTAPHVGSLLALGGVTLILAVGLTTVPARIEARRPIVATLRDT